MEINYLQSINKQSKSKLPRNSSKNNLLKIFTQRKSNPIIQSNQKNQPHPKHTDKLDQLPVLQFQRQNPITYLSSLQQNHKQIQKTLQDSYLTTNKWRSYNSPTQSLLNSKISKTQKQNILIQTLYSKKKQLSAIKVYNHINNDRQISTKNFQQPQYLQFIQQAVSKSTRKPNFLFNTNTNLSNNINSSKRISKLKKGFDIKQNYTIGDHRKQIQNLQLWIKSKVQSYQTNQTQGQNMFIDRINFLNMAFSQVSRIAGTFSSQTKNIIQYLHKKYYDYYNFITECMIQQNKNIKTQISQVQDRLLKTINYYQDKLKKSKIQNQQKSQKIVNNFQKCIEVKKKLQKQNKQIKRNFNNQKKKSKLVEQALIKVVTLFLALGKKNIQQMTFSLDSQSDKSQISMLAKSRKNILTQEQRQIQRRKQIFREWCGYLVKMIHRILIKDACYKQGIDIQTGVFKKQAFDVIKQYMVDNDDSLSLADAQNILNKFLSTQQQQIKRKQQLKNSMNSQKQIKLRQLQQLQAMNRKFQNMYSQVTYELPTFEQVYNKLSIHDVDIQVDIKTQTKNQKTQTLIQKQQIGTMTITKQKSRQVDVSTVYKNKNKIQNGVLFYCEVFKLKKGKQSKNNDGKYRPSYIGNQASYPSDRRNSHNLNIQEQLNKQYVQSNAKQRQKQNKISISSLVDIYPIDNDLRQAGINTVLTRVRLNTKCKSVQFNIPSNQNQQQAQIDTIGPDDIQQLQDKTIQQNQDQDSKSNKQSLLQGSIKQLAIDAKSNQSTSKKFLRGKRKNGFIISGDRKKTHLSQKFIANNSQSSISSNQSINSDEQQSQQKETSPFNQQQSKANKNKQSNDIKVPGLKRQVSLLSENSSQNNRISIERQTNIQRPYQKNKTKFQTLEQRLGMNRSFFNLSHIEYATQQDADVNRIKDHVIRVPKKKTYRQKFLIDPYDFHLQLAFKNHQKLKFISSITLWHPKLMFQMKKIRNRVNNIKSFTEMDNKTINLVKGYFTHIVNPLLKDNLKSYCQQFNNDKFDFGENSLTTSYKKIKNANIKKQLSESSGFDKTKIVNQQLSYNQRLSPLLYNVINYTQYNQNKTSSDNEIFFSGLKTLKNKNSKMQVYNILMEGRCVEVDIFTKTVYQFNVNINNNISYNPEISYYIIEHGMGEALQGYFTVHQLKKILLQVKNYIISQSQNMAAYRRSSAIKSQFKRDSVRNNHIVTKKLNQKAKIPFFDLLLIIFRYIKEKQQIHVQKYSIINQIISRNSQCISYQDIMHFLQCLPITNEKRKKILNHCLKHIVYWNSAEATVSKDILYFILDKYELYTSNNGSNHNLTLIKEYIVNRCDLYFKGTLQKVTKNPEWVLNSTYILSYKIPKIFHRILYQIKTGKNPRQRKTQLCLLTLIFCNLIDVEMDKRFMPSLLNGLIAIPFI